MRRQRRAPQRSCVACRQPRAKNELLRVVRTPTGEVCVDETGKVAGRGAYLCYDVGCVEQALKQKKLSRALAVAIDEEVAGAIRESASRVDAAESVKG